MSLGDTNERGLAYSTVVLIIVALMAAGFVGWVVYSRSNPDKADTGLQRALDKADCKNVSDNDLCKFFTSWKASSQYTVSATSRSGSDTTSYNVRHKSDDTFYLKATGAKAYETVVVDDTLYTRTDGGSWYKQPVEADTDLSTYKADNALNFTEPTSQNGTQVTYTKIGKESCSERTCFKYQVSDPSKPGTIQYIWFDDEEYRLRRMQANKDNYSYDANISFANVSVTPPTEFTPVVAGESITPGESQPTGLPATGDTYDTPEYQLWLEQRQTEL